jgi:hypothetical protein
VLLLVTYKAQAAAGTLIGGDRLIVIAGMEQMEYYRTHQTPGFHVFDTIPLTQFNTLL